MYYLSILFLFYGIINIMKMTPVDFAERLKKTRRSKGLTQYELADLMKTSQRMIAHYETKGNRPRIDKVKALASALNVPIEELAGMESSKVIDQKNEETSFSILKRVKIIEKLPVRDQKAIFRLINSLAQKNKLKGRL